MTPEARRRYARHLTLPEIGAAGQERLCASRATLAPGADPRAARWAEAYLVRAGVRVGWAGGADESPSASVLALPDAATVRGVAGPAHLEDAAAYLLGALAALEHVRAVALPTGARPIPPLTLRDEAPAPTPAPPALDRGGG